MPYATGPAVTAWEAERAVRAATRAESLNCIVGVGVGVGVVGEKETVGERMVRRRPIYMAQHDPSSASREGGRRSRGPRGHASFVNQKGYGSYVRQWERSDRLDGGKSNRGHRRSFFKFFTHPSPEQTWIAALRADSPAGKREACQQKYKYGAEHEPRPVDRSTSSPFRVQPTIDCYLSLEVEVE